MRNEKTKLRLVAEHLVVSVFATLVLAGILRYEQGSVSMTDLPLLFAYALIGSAIGSVLGKVVASWIQRRK